ncbi:hypothetical protein H696_01017, partial [Fonticula alba]
PDRHTPRPGLRPVNHADPGAGGRSWQHLRKSGPDDTQAHGGMPVILGHTPP